MSNAIAMTSSTTAAQAKKILHQAQTVEQLESLFEYICKWHQAYKLGWKLGPVIEEKSVVETMLTGKEIDLLPYRWITASASTDLSRPTLVHLYVTQDEQSLASTDGYRLHVMDGHVGREIAAMVGAGVHAHAKIGKRQAIGPVIEDIRYPDYGVIIPERKAMTGHEYSLTDALEAVKANTEPIEGFAKGVIGINAEGRIVNPRTDENVNYVNVEYVLDALNVGKLADTVTIWIGRPERPIMIDLTDGGLSFGFAVLMPIFKKNVTFTNPVETAVEELEAILAG